MRRVVGAVLRAPLSARTWRAYAYVLTGVVVAVPPFLLALLGVVASVLSLFTVGLPLLVGVLALARCTPRWFRGPARWLLGWSWPSPPPLGTRRPLRWARALITDAPAWRALAYGFLHFPIILVAAYAGTIAVVTVPLAVTFPAWWLVFPGWLGTDTETWAGTWWIAAQGGAVLLVLPWFLRLLVGLDRLLAKALLGPDRARTRIAALESGRAALRADAAATLRRVERDLHDGTQARLVLLGVTLSRVERRVTDEAARALLAGARGTVTEALAELREIIRGIHPPALDDGLPTALATLAARSAVPVDLSVDLPERPPDDTATALYFTTAELLTNVARHAGASRVRVVLRGDDRTIRLTVTDDGHGGAAVNARADGGGTDGGTGLAGLARRAAALDGSLAVDSPPGGPTTVTVTLPRES